VSKGKDEHMKYPVLIAVCLLLVLTAGCITVNTSPPATPVPSTPPATTVPATTVPLTTTVPTPSLSYKTADLVLFLNTKPAYGFRIEYPADWTYKREPTRHWKAGYNFSSPDNTTTAGVFFSDQSGSGNYFYPLATWANNTIRSMTEPYCLDGAGNPLEWDYCTEHRRVFYHPFLVSNEPVTIKGAFNARRLVFSSEDDENYGERTLYIMHSGQMEGYNYTVPGHPEVAVKVDGPAWDYGVNGQAYAIEFYAPPDKIDATSGIFAHMINSFEAKR
jgi:hypothetical protein